MKKILSILLLSALAISCKAQIYLPIKTWYQYDRLKIQDVLVFPSDTVKTKEAGAVVWINGKLWTANGTSWSIASGSGGPGITYPVVGASDTGLVTPAMKNIWDAAVSGFGAINRMPKFSATKTLTNGLLTDNGANLASDGPLMYNGDYSSSFTNRSVPDVDWVNNLVLGITANGSSDLVNTTISTLDASTTFNTAKTYFVTDLFKTGFFRYVGTVANQAQDDGVMNIVTANLKLYTRIFDGKINAAWFGVNNAASASANVTALRKARDYALAMNAPLYMAGDFSINDTIVFQSTTTKRAIVNFTGTTTYTGTGDCFVIASTSAGTACPVLFEHSGIIAGSNTGGVDSATYNNYTGRGVWCNSCYNSTIRVNEIKNFRVGIEMSGGGSKGIGAQLNHIWFNRLYNNRAQIYLTNYTGANAYNNQSDWHGGQLGSGTTTSGAGGTFGILTDNTASGAQTTGISGHAFYDIDFEGLRVGIKSSMSNTMRAFVNSFEPGALMYHIVLDNATAQYWHISTAQAFNVIMIPTDRAGYKTIVDAPRILSAAGTYEGNMMQFNSTTQRWKVFASEYTGFSDAFSYLSEDKLWFESINSAVEAIMVRTGGVNKWIGYKGRYLRVSTGNTGSSADDTLSAPPNLGYVYVSTNEPKYIKLSADDQAATVQVAWAETFKLELASPTSVTFLNSSGASVAIGSSNFPSAGKYEITRREGGYTVTCYSCGGGGGSTPIADSTTVGSVSTTTQKFQGSKQFDAILTKNATFYGGNFPYTFYKRVNGMSFGEDGTPNITNTTGTYLNWSSASSSRDLIFGVGKKDVRYMGFGNNGSDFTLFGEVAGTGFDFRNNVGYSTMTLASGQSIMKLFGTGNLVVGTGALIDSGYKLDVKGSIRTTGGMQIRGLAGSGIRRVVTDDNGNLSYQSLNYLDAGSSFANDPVVSDGAGKSTTRRPPYQLAYSVPSTTNVSGTNHSKTTLFVGGAQTITGANLAIGDKIVISGEGAINAPAAPSTNQVAVITLDINGYTQTFVTALDGSTYNSNISPNVKPYKFVFTLMPTGTGTTATARLGVDLTVSKELAVETGKTSWYNVPISSINTVNPTVNVSVTWSSATTSTSSLDVYYNSIEIFRQ